MIKETDKHWFIQFLILIFHEILLYTSNNCFLIKRFIVNNYSNPDQVSYHIFFLFVVFISLVEYFKIMTICNTLLTARNASMWKRIIFHDKPIKSKCKDYFKKLTHN